MWLIENGELINNENTTWVESAFITPYPSWLWQIGENGLYNNNLLEDINTAFVKPYPSWLWRVENISNDGFPYNELLPEIEYLGAFCNCKNLTKVYIPDSVKKIGEYAFYKTALKRVEIAEDCEYYITSFPDGCEIVGGVWDNLTDKNDDILEDNSGSEIMVRRVN